MMDSPAADEPEEPSEDELIIFDEVATVFERPTWKVAVIDDDAAVQEGTRFALADFELDGHGIELLCASSAAEGRALLGRHPDIAVILLDVVMETENAGLDLVEYIRRTLKNDIVRIVLRTGQPGQAPERSVVVDYDINDYKSKTELTATRLFTTITAALRAYHQLHRMALTRRGLETIIEATANLGDLRSVRLLAEGILTQISSLLDVECAGILVLRDTPDHSGPLTVLAGSGCYGEMVGREAREHLDADLLALVEQAFLARRTAFTRERKIIFVGTETGTEIVVVLDSARVLSPTDHSLLGIFCNRLSASLDNLVLYDQLREANRTLEQRIAERTEALAASNRQLQDGWQRARRSNALQSEILGMVAHDLKNPLSIVLGRAEILAALLTLEPVGLERCFEQIVQVKEAARRMSTMVDELVADAMAEAQDITIRQEPGNLAELLRDVVEANRPLAERKSQSLVVAAPQTLPARFDAGRLRDAVDNLVSNAVKYSPAGGTIQATLGAEGPDAILCIIDHGPGLLPEDVERLFGRFQRLSAKPTGGESSTGLGLFSAKRIVDLHGGSLSAQSAGPGQGTTFLIRLPGTPRPQPDPHS